MSDPVAKATKRSRVRERSRPQPQAGATKRPDPQTVCDMAHMAQHEPHSDVLGSYTGTAADGGRPVQDADDL